MAATSPAKFIREVRQEMARVTWPTRKETGISTAMVLALVSIAAAFFTLADWLLGVSVRAIIGF